MDSTTLEEEVRELLDKTVESIDDLDALVLLIADPTRWWPLMDIARAICVDLDSARDAMRRLRGRRLVIEMPAGAMYRLADDSPVRQPELALLARACRKHRDAALSHITERTLHRIGLVASAFTRGGRR